jgi:hypothetical protein
MICAQIRDLVSGVREAFVQWSCRSFAAKIHVSAMSIAWLQTYEDESEKHRAEA